MRQQPAARIQQSAAKQCAYSADVTITASIRPMCRKSILNLDLKSRLHTCRCMGCSRNRCARHKCDCARVSVLAESMKIAFCTIYPHINKIQLNLHEEWTGRWLERFISSYRNTHNQIALINTWITSAVRWGWHSSDGSMPDSSISTHHHEYRILFRDQTSTGERKKQMIFIKSQTNQIIHWRNGIA